MGICAISCAISFRRSFSCGVMGHLSRLTFVQYVFLYGKSTGFAEGSDVVFVAGANDEGVGYSLYML